MFNNIILTNKVFKSRENIPLGIADKEKPGMGILKDQEQGRASLKTWISGGKLSVSPLPGGKTWDLIAAGIKK